MAEPADKRETVFVAKTPIKFGIPGERGDFVWLNPGDPLPETATEEQTRELRQAGVAVPKDVWEALHASETAFERARQVQEAANAEAMARWMKSGR
jgi:hypothetical protein